MPFYDPYDTSKFDPAFASPALVAIPPATLLYRVHHRTRAASELNPTTPTPFRGGRFDSDDGSYSYLYASTAPDGAIAERLVLLLKFGAGPRVLPKVSVDGLVLSEVEVRTTITVLSLVGADASHVGQDLWLTTSDPIDYVRTRIWAKAIRSWVPTAEGFRYLARHDQSHDSCVLLGPPIGGTDGRLSVTSAGVPLDTPDGYALVRAALQRHNATLSS